MIAVIESASPASAIGSITKNSFSDCRTFRTQFQLKLETGIGVLGIGVRCTKYDGLCRCIVGAQRCDTAVAISLHLISIAQKARSLHKKRYRCRQRYRIAAGGTTRQTAPSDQSQIIRLIQRGVIGWPRSLGSL